MRVSCKRSLSAPEARAGGQETAGPASGWAWLLCAGRQLATAAANGSCLSSRGPSAQHGRATKGNHPGVVSRCRAASAPAVSSRPGRRESREPGGTPSSGAKDRVTAFAPLEEARAPGRRSSCAAWRGDTSLPERRALERSGSRRPVGGDSGFTIPIALRSPERLGPSGGGARVGTAAGYLATTLPRQSGNGSWSQEPKPRPPSLRTEPTSPPGCSRRRRSCFPSSARCSPW